MPHLAWSWEGRGVSVYNMNTHAFVHTYVHASEPPNTPSPRGRFRTKDVLKDLVGGGLEKVLAAPPGGTFWVGVWVSDLKQGLE